MPNFKYFSVLIIVLIITLVMEFVLAGVTIPASIAPLNTIVNLKNSQTDFNNNGNQTDAFTPIALEGKMNITISARYFTLINLPTNRIIVLNISEVDNCKQQQNSSESTTCTSSESNNLKFLIQYSDWVTEKKYEMVITPNTNFTLKIKNANDSTFYSIGVFRVKSSKNIDGAITDGNEYNFLFQLDVVDSIEMPEYVFVIIMICSGLVASIMFLITLIQSGVSMTFVLGVDFFSLCYRRGKKGYSQINVNIPEEE